MIRAGSIAGLPAWLAGESMAHRVCLLGGGRLN